MLVEFHCPKCGRALRADESYSGKKAQCRTCKTVLLVPREPPVHEAREQARNPVETSEPEDSGFAREERDLISEPAELEVTKEPKLDSLNFDGFPASPGDTSYGIASLYLAALSFLLFLTPAALAGLTGVMAMWLSLLVAAGVSGGCFIFCWHGLKFAKLAQESPAGKGFAAAGILVNKFFLKFYVIAIIFFIGAAIYAIFYVKNAVGGGGIPGLDRLKDIQKLTGQ